MDVLSLIRRVWGERDQPRRRKHQILILKSSNDAATPCVPLSAKRPGCGELKHAGPSASALRLLEGESLVLG